MWYQCHGLPNGHAFKLILILRGCLRIGMDGRGGNKKEIKKKNVGGGGGVMNSFHVCEICIPSSSSMFFYKIPTANVS